MKTVLWISRHNLVPKQVYGLECLCGGPFRLIQHRENVEDIAELLPDIRQADIVAAVLPVHLLAQLKTVAMDTPVLLDQTNRELIPNPGGEPLTRYSHGGWKEIAALELKLIQPKPLTA